MDCRTVRQLIKCFTFLVIISATIIGGRSHDEVFTHYNNPKNNYNNIPQVIELVGYNDRKARTHYKLPLQAHDDSVTSSSTKIQADIETVKQNIEKYNKLLAVDTKNLPKFQKDMLQRIVERVARLKESLDIDEKLTQVFNQTQYKKAEELNSKQQNENEKELESITHLPLLYTTNRTNKIDASLPLNESALMQLRTSMDTITAVQAAVTSVQTRQTEYYPLTTTSEINNFDYTQQQNDQNIFGDTGATTSPIGAAATDRINHLDELYESTTATTSSESPEQFTDTMENTEYFAAARSNNNKNSKNDSSEISNLPITAAFDNENNDDTIIMLSTPTSFTSNQQQQRTLATNDNKVITVSKIKATKRPFYGPKGITQLIPSTKRKPVTGLVKATTHLPFTSFNNKSQSSLNYSTMKYKEPQLSTANQMVPSIATAVTILAEKHQHKIQAQHHNYPRTTHKPSQKEQFYTHSMKPNSTAGGTAANIGTILASSVYPSTAPFTEFGSTLPSSFSNLFDNNLSISSSVPPVAFPLISAPDSQIGETPQTPVVPIRGTSYSSSTNQQNFLYDNVNTSAIIDSLNNNAREGDHIIISTNTDQNISNGNNKSGSPMSNGNSGKPTKYHYYPHNQHIYLLPECAIQQVCNAVYVRLNYTQPLCACPSRYRDPCSASLNEDDQHTTKLVGDSKKKAITLAKTCEATTEMRECRTPKDWSLLALQNTRTGKSHYLVICRCPEHYKMDGPMAHDQNTYASVPGIRVFGMMCVKPGYSVRKQSAQPPKRFQMNKPYYRPGMHTNSQQYGRPSLNGGSGSSSLSSISNYQNPKHPSFTNSHSQTNYEYLNRPDGTINTNFHNTYHSTDTLSINNFPTSGGYGRNNERTENLPAEMEVVKPDEIVKKMTTINQHTEPFIDHNQRDQREKRSLIDDFETSRLSLHDADIPEFPWEYIREFEANQMWN